MARTFTAYLQYVQQLFTPLVFLGSNLRAYLIQLLIRRTTNKPPIKTQAALTDEPPKCRFRLDNESSDTLILPGGRKLGYAQYGSLTGKAIFYLHGLPGSRIEAASYHEFGLELGARIIATDRPGIGWSSPHPGRTLLDFPKDLERLAEHLGLDEYSVLGVSGGGPYALACAASLPREKLQCVSIVCGLGPPDIGMSGANWGNWLGFTFGWRYSPTFLLRWYFQLGPVGRLDLTDEQRLQLLLSPSSLQTITNKKDLEVMTNEDFLRLLLRSTRESKAQGFDGVRQDGKVMCLDFGFRIEDIRPDLPVQLWYGKQDTFVPLNHGEQIAARLGGRAQLRVVDETHASISTNCKKEVLEEIIAKM